MTHRFHSREQSEVHGKMARGHTSHEHRNMHHKLVAAEFESMIMFQIQVLDTFGGWLRGVAAEL